MLSNPKVSVLMITYKHEKFIEQAINSVLEQNTNFEYELIIANDNSPDATHEVVTKIIREHPRSSIIKYFKNKVNLGPNANYNKAYFSGKGEYIAVCEGDDFWEDKLKLQKQVDFLDQNPEYVLTYHDAKCIDESGNNIANVSNCNPPKELSKIDLQTGNQPLPLTTCYRKIITSLPEEMEKVINGDTFLISILGSYGKGKWLNISPASYRHHQNGVWSLKNKTEKLKSKIELFEILKNYYHKRSNPNLAAYFEKELNYNLKSLFIYSIRHGNFFSAYQSGIKFFKLKFWLV